MGEGKKKRWDLTLVLCVVLLGANLWQGKRISDLEQDIWNAQNSVMDSVSRVDQRLASLRSELERADDLVRDWSYTSAVDMEKHGLDIQVSLVLKEWQAGTGVELLFGGLDGPGGETVVPLSGDGAGTFTGTVRLLPHELSGEYDLDAVIVDGETQRRERLGWLGGLAELLPLRCASWGYSGLRCRNGVFTISDFQADLYSDTGGAPEGMGDAVFRLKRNGEAVEEGKAQQADRMGSFTCDEEWSVGCRPGDEVALTFSCRDGSGLGYEFFLEGWTIVDEDSFDCRAPGAGWPKLTWE